jgi:hypothetical protein
MPMFGCPLIETNQRAAHLEGIIQRPPCDVQNRGSAAA